MQVKRELIALDIEATYGVENAPAATDAILVENVSYSPANLRMNDRPAIRRSKGMLQKVYGGRLMQLTCDVEVKGSGVAGVAPEIGKLFRIADLAETIVAGTSVTYQPASEGNESGTLYYYQDGILNRLVGCKATVSATANVGEVMKASFTITGHELAPSDTPLITPTYDSAVPPVWINANFSIGASAAVISTLSIDLGNQVATPPDMNAADGFAEVRITDRDVSGSFNPEATLIAVNDFIGDLKSGNTLMFDTGVIGLTAGNRVQITGPAVYYKDVTQGDRDGIRTYEVPIGFTEVTTDDEISFIFT